MLILDLGLYPQDSALRAALAALEGASDHETLELDTAAMGAADWDQLLGKILDADRCLTL